MRWRFIVAVFVAAAACWGAVTAAAPAARKAQQTPALTVRPRAAPRGGRVVLYGRGFAPLARVVLLAGLPGGKPMRIGKAKTDADGAFVAPITIRKDVDPGRYVAYACRHSCRVRASAPFRVLTGG